MYKMKEMFLANQNCFSQTDRTREPADRLAVISVTTGETRLQLLVVSESPHGCLMNVLDLCTPNSDSMQE